MKAPAGWRIAPLATVSFLAACGGEPAGSNSSTADNRPPPISDSSSSPPPIPDSSGTPPPSPGSPGSPPSIPDNSTTPPPSTGPSNSAPQISGSPARGAALGQPYSFRPAAQDADGDPLSFGIQNRPAWAAFNSSNGTLLGTPACADTGTYANVVISVSDGKTTTALPAFSIIVGTTAVTVSWVPPTTNTDGTRVQGLDGFGVYYGTAPGQYSQFHAVPDPGTRSACLSGLSAGTTWYFAVTAISSSLAESAYSIEVSKTLH